MRLALLTTDNREDRRDYGPARPWFGTSPQALLDGFSELPGEIEVHVVSCSRVHLPSPLQLASNIVFHSVYVPSWAWLKLGYLGNILAVRRCLKTIKPDLVHGQGTERDCALSAVFSGYRNLITIHGNMRRLARLAGAQPWSFAGLTALLESLALRLAGGVVCLSRHTERMVVGRARRTWVLPNAVNPAASQNPEPARTATPLILLVGDVVPNKNPLAFLQAIAGLQPEFLFEVALCGKCDPAQPYAQDLLRFIAHHPWCRAPRFLSHPDLLREMTRATLLVLPSLEENLPMVILEAMAAGLPVAASHVGGIPDLITDGETGRLFDPADPTAIRHAVQSMLADPAGSQQLAARARERILRDHLPQTIARRQLAIYEEKLKVES